MNFIQVTPREGSIYVNAEYIMRVAPSAAGSYLILEGLPAFYVTESPAQILDLIHGRVPPSKTLTPT